MSSSDGPMDDTTTTGRKLDAFVRPGGEDKPPLEGMVIPDYLEEFLKKNEEWNENESAPTVFNNPDNFDRVVKTFMRFQATTSDSTLWYIRVVTVAGAVFYSQSLQTGTTAHDAEAIQIYAYRVGRYLRNKFSDQDICPRDIILNIYKQCNSDCLVYINCNGYLSPKNIYEQVQGGIRKIGACIIEEFLFFEEYVQRNDLFEFSGDYNKKKKLPTLDGKEVNNKHSVLIVGSKETGSGAFGGVKLLIHDSNNPNRPFAVVGLDLVQSMGATNFVGIKAGLSSVR